VVTELFETYHHRSYRNKITVTEYLVWGCTAACDIHDSSDEPCELWHDYGILDNTVNRVLGINGVIITVCRFKLLFE